MTSRTNLDILGNDNFSSGRFLRGNKLEDFFLLEKMIRWFYDLSLEKDNKLIPTLNFDACEYTCIMEELLQMLIEVI